MKNTLTDTTGEGNPAKTPSRSKEAPCSSAQERLWFLYQLEPNGAVYNLPAALRIRGPLKIVTLEQSLNEIIRRHEALRTTFSFVEGKPVQTIASALNLSVSVVDLAHRSKKEREDNAQRLATDAAQQPFDLARGPLLRAHLIRLGDENHLLLLIMHRIIGDTRSLSVLFRELSVLYDSFLGGQPSPLSDLPAQYSDFAIWQRERERGKVFERHLSYWRKRLKNLSTFELPTDRARPAVPSFRGTRQFIELSQDLMQRLVAVSRKEGATLFMTLLAAFQILLHRYTGEDDVVLGSPVTGRNQTEFDALIGVFANTVILRTDLSGNPTFNQLLARVRETVLGAYAHQDVSLENLVEALQPERNLSRSPFFQVMFAIQNEPKTPAEMSGLEVTVLPVDAQTAEFDLFLLVTRSTDMHSATIEYNTDLFDQQTIERLLRHFQTLLDGIAANSLQRISELPILMKTEKRQLMLTWNSSWREHPADKCVHQLFENQVERSPDAVAVVFNDQELTYRQLNGRSNQLARYLRKLGVRPELLVGICLDRSIDMIVGLLAILKAGGSYLPLDPGYPVERLKFMLEDSRVFLLLTQQHLLGRFSSAIPNAPTPHASENLEANIRPEPREVSNSYAILLDRDWSTVGKESEENLDNWSTADSLAYVIYTSGSSGIPKGVLVEHRGLCNLAAEQLCRFQVDKTSRVLQFASPSFDASIFEIVMALCAGARLYLKPSDTLLAGAHLADFLRTHEITIATLPPSVLAGIPSEPLPKLTAICVAGEACPAAVAKEWSRDRRFFNLYGPTEATVWTTCGEYHGGGDSVSIGRPIANAQVYILDAYLNPLPIGVVGEIYIGGCGIARGYLNRPDLTADRFIYHSFEGGPSQRLYKTGDLGRYLPDGNIEFLGRVDNQVKIRGFRIELGEIEAALNRHPGVQDSVVTARNDNAGEKHLVAYIVPKQPADTVGSDLKWAELENAHISNCELLFEETFANAGQPEDPTTNTAGVNSSYSHTPISASESRDWVDHAANRILSLKPNRVLDIGCGLGRTLFRLAPYCSRYWGADISQVALKYVERHLDLLENKREVVRLFHARADDFSAIPKSHFDTIVMNGVVQYLPHIDHLVKVLESTLHAVEPGGAIFIGDVRSLPLLDAFQLSVELSHAPDSLSTDVLWQRVKRKSAQEEELLIDPAFFDALPNALPRISCADILLKRGWAQNELTRFRYDVFLYLGPQERPQPDTLWLDWVAEKLTLPLLRARLADKPEALAITGVPNARVLPEVRAAGSLANGKQPATANELRSAMETVRKSAFHPEAFWALEHDLPYSVDITWSHTGSPEFFDVILRHRQVPGRRSPANFLKKTLTPRPWRVYAHNPIDVKLRRALRASLPTHLGKTLPSYMIPSAFVFLNSVPLSPNGKIDRNRLPEPDPTGFALEQSFVAPQSSAERLLAQIWSSLLGFENPVGVHDNFFDLGGHSLMATQVLSRIREEFQLDLSLRTLFEQPTVARLARVITEMQAARTDASHVLAGIESLSDSGVERLII